MDWTQLLNSAYTWIVGLVGSVGIGTLVGCVVGLINSRKQHKIAQAYYDSVEKLVNDSYNAGIDRIKNVTFNHDIQPLVKSELEKVNEYATSFVKEELDCVKLQYTKFVNIIEALAKYFDNSIGVSEEAKEALKQAINDAKQFAEISIPVESSVTIENPVQTTEVESIKPKTSIR